MSLGDLFGGGGSNSRPPPPPIYPLDIAATDEASRNAGLYQWELSNKEYEKQYPGIVAAQNARMTQLDKQLNGPLDPTLQRGFLNNAEADAMTAFGGGREGANITGAGSIGKKSIASGVASQTSAYQDDLRNQARELISEYPQANMPSPNNVVQGSITNLSNQVSANNQAAGYQAAGKAAQIASDAQGTSTAIGAGTALASAALSSAIAAGAISW